MEGEDQVHADNPSQQVTEAEPLMGHGMPVMPEIPVMPP